MRKMKVFTSALVLAAVICAFGLSGFAASAQDAPAAASSYWDTELALGSKEEIEQNFDFHFVSTQNARRSDKFEYSWEIKDGALHRIGNVDSASDTINIAILTYKGDVYDDFEMQVDIKEGCLTPYWAAVGVRQQIPGKYYTTSGGGTGVFMQQNGKITLWGPISNGIVEKNIPSASSWFPMQWRTMRIVARGTQITVYIDAVEVLRQSVNSTDYVKGYISFQSVNNDCSLRNFKIKSLSVAASKDNEENRFAGANDGTPLEELV